MIIYRELRNLHAIRPGTIHPPYFFNACGKDAGRTVGVTGEWSLARPSANTIQRNFNKQDGYKLNALFDFLKNSFILIASECLDSLCQKQGLLPAKQPGGTGHGFLKNNLHPPLASWRSLFRWGSILFWKNLAFAKACFKAGLLRLERTGRMPGSSLFKLKNNRMQSQQLSSLMRLSWKFQYAKKTSRPKSLASAWVICQQADIMVYYLIKKHTPPNRRTETIAGDLTLIF